MAKRLMLDKLIDKSNISEELRYIKDSDNAYITPTGKIYVENLPNKFYRIKTHILFDYEYCQLNFKNGQRKNLRVHRLVADAYISNTDPKNYNIVGHKNNIKNDNRVENLYWTNTSENTKKAFDDGILKNAKSWDDSQSIPIAKLDLNGNLIKFYGSAGEAALDNNITKTAVLVQCKTTHYYKPRKGFYYRFKEEYDKFGFVL